MTYSFDEFRLSTEDRRLYRLNGEEVPLTPRVFDLLLLLVQSFGTVLTKDEILDAIWPDSIVEESNLSQNIFVLRKALGESTQNPRFIRTVPTKGYRFIGDVQVVNDLSPIERERGDPPDPSAHDSAARDARAEASRSNSSKRSIFLFPLIAAGTLILVALAFFGGRYLRILDGPAREVTYQQLTFDRGTVWTGRFLPGSNAVIYDANFNNRGLELYSLHLNTPESHPMGLPNTDLLSISSRGEMAILRDPTYVYQFIQRGTLATLSVDGAAPRDIAENVQEADWNPAGDRLAIVRWTETGNRLEYPIGTAIEQTTGYLSCPRLSPSGDRIGFFRHPFARDNRGTVAITDTAGNAVVATDDWAGLEGLAWHGDEVWFTASRNGEAYALYGLSQTGKVRTITTSVSNLLLSDVTADGSVLLSRAIQQTDVYLNGAGRSDADLSWLHLIGIADMANDGSAFLFTHFGEGSGKNYAVYLRKTDGSPAVKLGTGRGLALSPEGRWALTKISDPEGLTLLPTRAGDARVIPIGDLENIAAGSFSPDGKKLLFTANESGKPRRTFLVDLENSAPPVPLTEEGLYGTLLSPDGGRLLATNAAGERSLFSLTDKSTTQLTGLDRSDEVIRWGTDASTLYIYQPLDLPIRIYRLDLRSGKREMVQQIQPSNSTGVFGNIYLFTTPDAKVTLYGLRRYLIDLYLAKGLE